jgi:hypothetical protein
MNCREVYMKHLRTSRTFRRLLSRHVDEKGSLLKQLRSKRKG